MAKRKVALRGRSLVALLLIGFVLVAVGVISRRSYGYRQLRELDSLAARRRQLESEKSKIESDIRELTSRARLAPVAEQRLNMHIPNDSQVVILPRPAAHRPSGDAPR